MPNVAASTEGMTGTKRGQDMAAKVAHSQRIIEQLDEDQAKELLKIIAQRHPATLKLIKRAGRKPRVSEVDEPNIDQRKLFIRGLPWVVTEKEVRDAFEKYGDIIECAICTDRFTRRSRGYGFLTFKTVESASRALLSPTKEIGGRITQCNLASERSKKHKQTAAVAATEAGHAVDHSAQSNVSIDDSSLSTRCSSESQCDTPPRRRTTKRKCKPRNQHGRDHDMATEPVHADNTRSDANGDLSQDDSETGQCSQLRTTVGTAALEHIEPDQDIMAAVDKLSIPIGSNGQLYADSDSIKDTARTKDNANIWGPQSEGSNNLFGIISQPSIECGDVVSEDKSLPTAEICDVEPSITTPHTMFPSNVSDMESFRPFMPVSGFSLMARNAPLSGKTSPRFVTPKCGEIFTKH